MQLTKFEIKNLHDSQDCTLKFKENRLLLVGENGAGKTTVLRILFLFLSEQWGALFKYSFDSISATFEGEEKSITVYKSDISISKFDITQVLLSEGFPALARRRMNMMISEKNEFSFDELEDFCGKYKLPFHTIMNRLGLTRDLFGENTSGKKLQKRSDSLRSCITGTKVLYLPTYRRIEQNVDEFNRRSRSNSHKGGENYTEIFEFGMDDVEKAIKNKLESLKEFTRDKLNSLTLAYLGEVVDKKYNDVDVEEIKAVENDVVTNILDRIEITILSQKSKNSLLETIQAVKDNVQLDEHTKVICHYFSKLLIFQQELKKEEKGIRRFCTVCNTYLVDKNLEYTSSSFSFKVSSKNHKNIIELSHLSSGEKQIISLFSHLYLYEEKKFFVMIDEPELSLSVPWQRKFLKDISDGDFCSGFIAVTHSPFIYNNNLEEYVHGLDEFMKENKKK